MSEVRTIESDAANGMVEIFKTFLRYPGATIQLLVIIVGGAGVYYAITNEIAEVKSEVAHNHTEADTQMKQLLAQDLEARSRLEGVYSRGDTRYATLTTRLAEHDTMLAKISTNVDWIVRRLDTGYGVPAPTLR